MKLKKFEAPTEAQAIENARSELGKDALVLNIKKIKPKGVFSAFKKPYVEVTVAYEDKPLVKINNEAQKDIILKSDQKNVNNIQDNNRQEDIKSKVQETLKNAENEIKLKRKDEEITELEKRLSDTERLLENAMNQISSFSVTPNTQNIQSSQSNSGNKYGNAMLQFFYDSLVEQEILPSIAEDLLADIENVENIDSLDINFIVKIVYNRIMKILGNPVGIEDNEEQFAKNIVFIGPTGVGKTTTIAKLSSDIIINRGLNVGFITADTYRIAAVEQLKTYAEILDSDVAVVYNPDDLKEEIINLRAINNYIFVDTAGRSHKNRENVNELKQLLDVIEKKQIYLVLSITTKFEDILDIINAYSEFADFKIILTKLDETLHLGSILNICYKTKKEISYVSSGQNVPDDFEIVKPEKIAKALLGSIYK